MISVANTHKRKVYPAGQRQIKAAGKLQGMLRLVVFQDVGSHHSFMPLVETCRWVSRLAEDVTDQQTFA